MNKKRGILYIAWGQKAVAPLARSIESLAKWHPELPFHVQQLSESEPHTLLDKATMFDMSPFDTTLFLDVDTTILGNLNFAFEQTEKHGVAVSICECPWARRFPCIDGDVIEYNCGVIGFDRSPATKAVFDRWKELAPKVDSTIHFVKDSDPDNLYRMEHNDQAAFALALNELNFNPCALPINWNFRPQWHRSFFGPIKIWHDYAPPPENLIQWNADHPDTERVILYGNVTGNYGSA